MKMFAAPMTIVAAAAVAYGLVAVAPTMGAPPAASGQASSQVVHLDGASAAVIHLTLDTGDLWLAGGSTAAGHVVAGSELLRGDFIHEADQAPSIDYELVDNGHTGRLLIAATGSQSPWAWSSSDQQWELFVNPIVPTELVIEVGNGTAELAVGGMQLTDLDIAAGSGTITLDLTGDWRSSLTAKIAVGAGDVTIRTPRDTGVEIDVEQGFGTVRGSDFTAVNGVYVNDVHGETASEIEIEVEQGAGYLELTEA